MVKCSQCGVINPEGAKFCLECGTKLPMRCPNCEEVLPDSAKFCPNCGHGLRIDHTIKEKRNGLPDIAQRGERRIVTVLFADISGFTSMSEHMDPEEVRSLINRCFDKLVPVIEKYDGNVDKFIGDEIMALFGAPVAHEDDPARAMRAAAEMQEAIKKFNLEQATELAFHLGINTGLVVAGGIGAQGRLEYSVMGDAVNIASRLKDIAGSGEILVGADTYQSASAQFEFEAIAPMRVKGKQDRLAVYRFVGERAGPQRARDLPGLASEMIGRDDELETLIELTDRVKSGMGGCVLIVGDPGVGKSRLIEEWQSKVESREAEESTVPRVAWATGHGLSYGQGQPYHLLLDLLDKLIRIPWTGEEVGHFDAYRDLITDMFADKSAEIYPYLGHLLSLPMDVESREKVLQVDPSDLQALYIVSLRRMLLAMAERKPIILICEDIHWADPSSVEIISRLLPLVSETRILLCFTTRPHHDAPGWKLVTRLLEELEPRLTEVVLHKLSRVESVNLVNNLLQLDALPGKMRDVILERAEGNPLFMQEIIRMLIDKDILVVGNGRWIVKQEIELEEIPGNLQGLLMARIDRLPVDARRTLKVASVMGRRFSTQILEEVLQIV